MKEIGKGVGLKGVLLLVACICEFPLVLTIVHFGFGSSNVLEIFL